MAYWADNPEQNATALYGYGGDLAGNLWRFDINCTVADDAANKCKRVIKLATFELPEGTPQPITTRVEMTKLGTDRMIFVGTGKYLEQSDLTDKNVQSVYAIIDKGASTVSDRATLAGRTLENQTNQTRKVVDTNGNSPAAGWYVDFPDVQTGSERDNVDMVLAVGTLVVPTNVPTGSSDQVCNASGYSWINFFDFKTGEAVGGNPTTVAMKFANDLTTGINAIWLGSTPEIIRTGNATGPAKATGVVFGGVTAGVTGHRVGWREIFIK
jgi:type IV pilus assembly protein PilY1